ncbi:MAG: flagellar basal body P-ring protein FlgI [Paracoccaceae bacterium]
MTPLNAADGDLCGRTGHDHRAVSAQGDAASVSTGRAHRGHDPVGRPVEREIAFDLRSLDTVRLALRTPDSSPTAARIEEAINKVACKPVAVMTDPGTVALSITATGICSPAHVLGKIENIVVEPEQRAPGW